MFLVRGTETAINAVVHAIVAHIQRGEQHDTIAVDAAFQFAGAFLDLFHQCWVGGVDEDGGLLHRQAVLVQRLLDDFAHTLRRAFGVVDVVPNLFRGDERAIRLVGDTAFFRVELHISLQLKVYS